MSNVKDASPEMPKVFRDQKPPVTTYLEPVFPDSWKRVWRWELGLVHFCCRFPQFKGMGEIGLIQVSNKPIGLPGGLLFHHSSTAE